VACADPLTTVADVMATEQGLSTRAVARQLLEHYGARRPEFLRERLAAARGQVAADLLRVLARVEGRGAATFLAQHCAHPDQAVQQEALWQLERLPHSGLLGPALIDALRRLDGVLRSRVLSLMVRSKDKRFVDALAAYVASAALALEEAVEIGCALGQLGGPESLQRWSDWLSPSGVLRKTLEGPMARQVAAAAAMAEIPGGEAAAALRAARAAAGPAVAPWIARALQRQSSLTSSRDES
jgi:hypothetical protein